MLIVSVAKYDTSFLVDQIAGSCAIEGIVVSPEAKDQIAGVINGDVCAKAAKEAMIERYKQH